MLRNYIDNENASHGEWDGWNATGTATIDQLAAASDPLRGSLGVRVVSTAGNDVYAQKNNFCGAGDIGLGESIRFAFRFKPLGTPTGGSSVFLWGDFGGVISWLTYFRHTPNDRKLMIAVKDDAGAYQFSGNSTIALTLGRGHRIVVELHRSNGPGANDGYGTIYVNGQAAISVTGVDNDVRMGNAGTWFRIGDYYGRDGYSADFDEIKVGDSLADVEPYRPFQQGPQLSAVQPAIATGIIGAHRLLRK